MTEHLKWELDPGKETCPDCDYYYEESGAKYRSRLWSEISPLIFSKCRLVPMRKITRMGLAISKYIHQYKRMRS